MLFAYFSVSKSLSAKTRWRVTDTKAYLIEGGAPAGSNIRPGDDGCLTKRMRISTKTMHGKSSTNPRGMEIEEFPFNLIRRRKNDNRGRTLLFSFRKSSRDGKLGDDGIFFTMPWTKSIVVQFLPSFIDNAVMQPAGAGCRYAPIASASPAISQNGPLPASRWTECD